VIFILNVAKGNIRKQKDIFGWEQKIRTNQQNFS